MPDEVSPFEDIQKWCDRFKRDIGIVRKDWMGLVDVFEEPCRALPVGELVVDLKTEIGEYHDHSFNVVCNPHTCYLNSDLVTTEESSEKLIDDVNVINQVFGPVCSISDIHSHRAMPTAFDDIGPEKHHHVFCQMKRSEWIGVLDSLMDSLVKIEREEKERG